MITCCAMQLCRTFSERGACPYGARCRFIHTFLPPNGSPTSVATSSPFAATSDSSSGDRSPVPVTPQEQAALTGGQRLPALGKANSAPGSCGQAVGDNSTLLGHLGAALAASKTTTGNIMYPHRIGSG